jgi:hypothetical protein
MKNSTRKSSNARRRVVAPMVIVALAALASACGHFAMGEDVQRPAETEFGLGPRASARHVYTATLQPRQPLRLRQLQSVPVFIADAAGRPIENAVISIDGGMPEHSHGLPTKPRVTRSLGGGVYEIEGVRFSMGGWWELKLAVDSPAGADSVTFNLSL